MFSDTSFHLQNTCRNYNSTHLILLYENHKYMTMDCVCGVKDIKEEAVKLKSNLQRGPTLRVAKRELPDFTNVLSRH